MKECPVCQGIGAEFCPSCKEKRLLKALDIFSKRIEYAIFELQLEEDILLRSVNYGEKKPDMNGRLLEISAIGRITKTDKLMRQRKIIGEKTWEDSPFKGVIE